MGIKEEPGNIKGRLGAGSRRGLGSTRAGQRVWQMPRVGDMG